MFKVFGCGGADLRVALLANPKMLAAKPVAWSQHLVRMEATSSNPSAIGDSGIRWSHAEPLPKEYTGKGSSKNEA